jgi:mono/diheme cytochrome c family protein
MVTCSTCHAARGDKGIVDGLPNASLNAGAAILASAGDISGSLVSPIAAWGPGRLDVTTQAGTEPARIPDLRPVRWLSYLQQDATVRALDPVALTIRIETLVITSHNQTSRPPRVVALALAAYLLCLGDDLASSQAAGAGSPGSPVFATHCAGCHADPGLTGEPIPLSVVGTDPALGEPADRGTGTYRVPSLLGVATRGPLLHDGTIPSIDALFDPTRLSAAFARRLHGSGSVQGHPFGLDLADEDRTRLLDYVQRL